MPIQTLNRVFKMGSVKLPDPNPAMTPEEVKKSYQPNYSHLKTAEIEGPEQQGNELVYTFRPAPVKSKG